MGSCCWMGVVGCGRWGSGVCREKLEMKVKELVEKLQKLDQELEIDNLVDVMYVESYDYTYYYLQEGVNMSKVHTYPEHVEVIMDTYV